jgi:hypothetical protein
VIYATVAPMNRTVETRLLPQMAVLLDKLMVEKRDMTLDGVKVFEADDKFLPGKVAIGLAYLIVDTPARRSEVRDLSGRLSPDRRHDRRRHQRHLGHLLLLPGPAHAAGGRACWSRRCRRRPWPS